MTSISITSPEDIQLKHKIIDLSRYLKNQQEQIKFRTHLYTNQYHPISHIIIKILWFPSIISKRKNNFDKMRVKSGRMRTRTEIDSEETARATKASYQDQKRILPDPQKNLEDTKNSRITEGLPARTEILLSSEATRVRERERREGASGGGALSEVYRDYGRESDGQNSFPPFLYRLSDVVR